MLVETGTFYGDMIAAVRPAFTQIYSIELHPRLARLAQRRFAHDDGIVIMQGDSAVLIEPLLRRVREPAVLWLDGHYSGALTARGDIETPIVQELTAVLRSGSPDDVILVDDARLFGKNRNYPSIGEIQGLVARERPSCQVTIVDDIIRVQAQ